MNRIIRYCATLVVLALAACTPRQLAALRHASVAPAALAATPATSPTDDRPLASGYLYAADDTSPCSSLYGAASIPCNKVLNICALNHGVLVDTLMPSTFRCDASSPTIDDVPLELRSWYGR